MSFFFSFIYIHAVSFCRQQLQAHINTWVKRVKWTHHMIKKQPLQANLNAPHRSGTANWYTHSGGCIHWRLGSSGPQNRYKWRRFGSRFSGGYWRLGIMWRHRRQCGTLFQRRDKLIKVSARFSSQPRATQTQPPFETKHLKSRPKVMHDQYSDHCNDDDDDVTLYFFSIMLRFRHRLTLGFRPRPQESLVGHIESLQIEWFGRPLSILHWTFA